MTLSPRRLAAVFLLLAMAWLPVGAQPYGQRAYSQPELDQMLAPIALYPDPLLSQVLMASTYPFEVFDAARWSRNNSYLQGEEAVRAVQGEDWDPSVQSLVAFPQILAQMADNPEWTRQLGEAFLVQQTYVMDTIQQLRGRALSAGSLQSDNQIYVEQQGQAILIQPMLPQYVYVPYYDARVAYGTWWWPAFQPLVWAPWPGYARPYRPGNPAALWWGRPVGLSQGFFFGNFDWRYRQVRVVNSYVYRAPFTANRNVAPLPQRWQHQPQRIDAFAARQQALPSQVISLPSRAPHAELPVATFPERHERRIEPPQERRPPQTNALVSPQAPQVVQQPQAVQPRPSAQTPREPRNDPNNLERRRDFRPEPQVSRPAMREEQRPRMPDAVAVQHPHPIAEIRQPMPVQAPPPVREMPRPRMPEAQAPQQSSPERHEQRNGPGRRER